MKHDDTTPGPELLAAFVDGELDADTHRRVEAWLAAHPDAAAVEAGHRRLLHLWQETTPDEPSPASWEGLRGRIRKSLIPPGSPGRDQPSRILRWALAIGAAAAAVLAVAHVARAPGVPAPSQAQREDEAWEPLVLASRGDVEIHSVAANDVAALLVGDSPLQEALVLAAAGDVAVRSVAPDVDGMIPDMSGMGGQTSPMIVVPLGNAPDKDGDW